MTTQTSASLGWTFDHAVVGASDVAATVAFFAAFGFDPVRTTSLNGDDAGLLGVDDGAQQVELAVPGSVAGRIRIVESARPTTSYDVYSPRSEALDLYTRDMAASLAIAADTGARSGPVADYTIGPISLKQALVHGPDDVAVCLVEIPHRLPSVLDAPEAEDRLHSELHSLVCLVEDADIDAATAFWGDVAGLTVRSRFPIDVPEVSQFMELPEHTPCRMSVMSNPDSSAPRFELLAFDRPAGSSPTRPSLPLEPGASLPVFVTSDLDAAEAALAEPRRAGDTVVGAAPGGSQIAVVARQTSDVP